MPNPWKPPDKPDPPKRKSFEPICEHGPAIKATLRTIERAGYMVNWMPPLDSDGEHTFCARLRSHSRDGELFIIKGHDALKALCELEKQLGFEDLD